MKTVLAVLLFLPLAAFGNETAYQALRAAGAQRSKVLLGNVIEVKGRNGAPQPASWTILFKDPLARGGVRELVIASGRIMSEKTPLHPAAAPTFATKDLRIDSTQAFARAEVIARTGRLGFHSADYLLRCDRAAGAMWEVQLLDAQQRSLGSVFISAGTGAVISNTLVFPKGSWAAGGGMRGRLIRGSQSVGDKLTEFWTGQPPKKKN